MSESNRLSCGTAREDLHALHDGALGPDRAAALRTHAAECEGCAGELRFLAAVAAGLDAASVAAPAGAWTAIAARLDARVARASGRHVLAWAGLSLVLAVASAWMIAGAGTSAATDDSYASLIGNGAEVTSSAALNYALGGPLSEASDVPDVNGKTP